MEKKSSDVGGKPVEMDKRSTGPAMDRKTTTPEKQKKATVLEMDKKTTTPETEKRATAPEIDQKSTASGSERRSVAYTVDSRRSAAQPTSILSSGEAMGEATFMPGRLRAGSDPFTWDVDSLIGAGRDGPKHTSKVRTGSRGRSISISHSAPEHSTRDMADEIPMFPKATSMYIHSGNIINWNRLKRKPNQNSTDEICDCVAKTLASYLESADKTQLQYVTELYKVNSENIQVLDENERQEVKITVKVFVCAQQPTSVISEAVDKVLNELGTSFVETLLLAIAPCGSEDDDTEQSISLSTIQPYWEAMEELVTADKVLSLGICDLNKEALEDLYNWAKVKPCVDQVNLESCCVMPKDLTEYAKSINVQLLTHNDRPVFISNERLQETIRSVSTERDSDAWTPQWVVRYSGILKCRGIIKMKGYIFHAVRDNKKRLL